jgi:hypothetical protein
MRVTIERQQTLQDAGVLRVLSVWEVVDLPHPVATRLIATRAARLYVPPERAVTGARERAVMGPREVK